MSAHLSELLPPRAVGPSRRDLLATPERIAALPDVIRGPVVEAFVRSLETVFLAAVPVAVAAFALAFAVKELPLRGNTPAPADAVRTQSSRQSSVGS